MRVYVAGPSADREEVQAVQRFVRQEGHEINYDWTKEYGQGEPGVICAAEIAAVRDADAVLIILTDQPSVGSIVEFGAALGAAKPVVIYDERGGGTINSLDTWFFHHPLVDVCRDLETVLFCLSLIAEEVKQSS